MDDIVKRLREYTIQVTSLGGSFVPAICEEAAREIELLRKDAERYRWLRAGLEGDRECPQALADARTGDEMDAAIDAAMKDKP